MKKNKQKIAFITTITLAVVFVVWGWAGRDSINCNKNDDGISCQVTERTIAFKKNQTNVTLTKKTQAKIVNNDDGYKIEFRKMKNDDLLLIFPHNFRLKSSATKKAKTYNAYLDKKQKKIVITAYTGLFCIIGFIFLLISFGIHFFSLKDKK